MKVLVLASYVPGALGHGGRIRSDVLARAFAGHELHWMAPRDGSVEEDRWAAERGAVLHDLPHRARAPSRLRKIACWARGRSEVLGRRWTLGGRKAVEGRIRDGGYDLLVADGSHVLPLLPESLPPLLLHLHNVEAALFARGKGNGWFDRAQRGIEARLIAAIESGWAARAWCAVTVSDLDRQRVLSLAPGCRVCCIPNSVDLASLPLLPPRSSDGTIRLLFVGSLDYFPNASAVEELLGKCLPVLRAGFPSLRVRIVGSGGESLRRRFAGEDGVEWIGRADGLIEHYRSSDAVYLPIRDGGGTRIKVLEALALGRPMIATGVAVEGLPLAPGRHFLRAETPGEGAAALRAILDGSCASLVAAGRALVEDRFDHAKAVERFSGLLRGIAAAEPSVSRSPRWLGLLSRVGIPFGAAYLLAAGRR